MRIGYCSFEKDAAAILDILNEAIVNTTALYDYTPRSGDCMRGWFDAKESGRQLILQTPLKPEDG